MFCEERFIDDYEEESLPVSLSVGFDATPLLLPRTGIGNYSLELLRAMRQLADPPAVTLLSNRPLAEEFHTLGSASTTPFPSRWLWMHSRLPYRLKRQPLQLVHFPNNSAPVWSPAPYVLTIHDASLFLYPEHHPWQRLLTVRSFLPQAARSAAAIITVSEHAKQELLEILRLPAEKVHVVHEAAGAQFIVRQIRPKFPQSAKNMIFGLTICYLSARLSRVKTCRACCKPMPPCCAPTPKSNVINLCSRAATAGETVNLHSSLLS